VDTGGAVIFIYGRLGRLSVTRSSVFGKGTGKFHRRWVVVSWGGNEGSEDPDTGLHIEAFDIGQQFRVILDELNPRLARLVRFYDLFPQGYVVSPWASRRATTNVTK
jgi:hypothetical protein